MTATMETVSDLSGEVKIMLVDGRFRVHATTVGYRATTHEKYDDATREAFSHAKRYASLNFCKYFVSDDRYEKRDVVDGTSLTMQDIDGIVPRDIPHREYVLSRLGEKVGQSRLTISLSHPDLDIRAVAQDHPAYSRAIRLRRAAESTRDSATRMAPNVAAAFIETAAKYEAIADSLDTERWAKSIDESDQIIADLNR